jgi:ABC-type nitrate/sulfonate/bicarbonate transport system substrate-binding protein
MAPFGMTPNNSRSRLCLSKVEFQRIGGIAGAEVNGLGMNYNLLKVSRRAILCAGLGGVAGALLAACGGDSDPLIVTPAQDALIPDVVPTYIRLANSNTMADAPLLIALERALFSAETLEPELQLGIEDQNLIDLLTSGAVEIALGPIGPAFFNALQAGQDLKIIGPLSRAEAPLAMALMVSRERFERGEVTDVAGLAGQTIGMAHGGFSEYLLGKALESGGLTLDDVEIEFTSDRRLRTRLERGLIGGALIGEPEAAEALAAGQAVTLGEDYLPGYTASFAVTTGAYLTSNADTVSRFFRVLYTACEHMLGDAFFDDRNLTTYRLYHGTDAALLAQMRPYTCSIEGGVEATEIEALQQFYLDNDMLNLTAALDIGPLIDDALAREAAAATFEG